MKPMLIILNFNFSLRKGLNILAAFITIILRTTYKPTYLVAFLPIPSNSQRTKLAGVWESHGRNDHLKINNWL